MASGTKPSPPTRRSDDAAPAGTRSGPGTDPRLKNLAVLSHVLDRLFRVPGTRWRFGLEALLGLIPGAGDVVGSFVGAYGIWIAREIGAPASVQLRMLVNLGIDAIVGAIPFAGDLFDFAFKAHVRNQALLESWLARPHATRRSSMGVLVLALVVMALVFGGALWLAIASISWLAGKIGGA